MPPAPLDTAFQRSFVPAPTTQDDVQRYLHEQLKSFEVQIAREQQRQRDQLEEELLKLRQQLTTAVREQQQQQQTTLTTLREALEEMRKEVSTALHYLSQDVDRTAQQAEAQTARALEKLRNEVLEMVSVRDHGAATRQLLGDVLITLGKQLQDTHEDEPR